MKKIIITVVALLMATTSMFAGGGIRIGAKAAIVSNSTKVKNINDFTSVFKDRNTGYQVGLFVRATLPVVPVFVQPELLYCWNKYETTNSSLGEAIGNIKVSDFEVPVMFGLAPSLGNSFALRAYIGPVFNFATQVSIKDETYDSLSEMFKKPAVTWGAGIGMDFLNLIALDFRYYGQFKSEEVTVKNVFDSDNIDVKNKSWSVSLGILF